MKATRIYLILSLLVMGCQQVGTGQEKAVVSPNSIANNVTVADSELGTQLQINREALLNKSSSEQIRIAAATVMLFSEDPLARKILLDVLKQSENGVAARIAVCRALGQTIASQKSVNNKEDFISPLFEILIADDSVAGRLAAEAMLIFSYDQVSGQLEKIAADASLPVKARLNAIYALKLQPDMRAVFQVMNLLDDPESQVSAAAETTLRSLAVPVGNDEKSRKEIAEGIKRRGVEKFQRDRLIQQESRIRNLENEVDLYQKQYLAALDKIYEDISEDAAKGKFLLEQLANSEEAVKLWALEKVYQWRLGTKLKLPQEIGPVLISLVGDQHRNVRLKTAQLLSLVGELNSAEKVLEQLRIEKDDEVKTELFAALGGACYYALLPDSEFKISPDIRKQTLEWAEKYLSDQEPKKAQKGAEVIKKLLEPDGLVMADVHKYLDLLAARYEQADNDLKGDLLSSMAGLCAQGTYKADAAKVFKSLFEKAINDQANNLIREAAVDGIIYIDKTNALNTLKKDLINDSSVIVKKKIIDLAGDVGGQDDLVWLGEKLAAVSGEGESAWQAMLKIFKRSNADVMGEWLSKLAAENAQGRITDEQMIAFLEMTERKADGENKLELLKAIRQELASSYIANSNFELAAECLGKLREAAKTDQEKEEILNKLLEVYLKWPNVKKAADLIYNSLLGKDLEPNDVIVQSIDSYLNTPPEGGDPNTLLAELAKIRVPEQRPKWMQRMELWTGKLNQTADANGVK
jgi:hypothetical protein